MIARRVTPRPNWIKYLFGQHILNGFAASLSILCVALACGASLGFTHAMAAALGALCVSVGDQPAPFFSKARILPLAWLCAVAASMVAALSAGSPWLEGPAIVLTGFVAGLLIAWGRWAIPLSVQIMLAMVLALGAPAPDLAARLHYTLLFALGGGLYIPFALGLTRLLDASGRRLTVAEVMRQFAAFLRSVSQFYCANADWGAVYLDVVEQQAALADHLQTARSLIVDVRDREVGRRLTAALALLLEAFDNVVAAHADHAPLLLAEARKSLAWRIRMLAQRSADDLDRLALDLAIGRRRLGFRDRREALDSFAREIAIMEKEPGVDPRLLRVARMTRLRFAGVAADLARLPHALANSDAAERILAGVDLRKFVPPLRVSLAALWRELRWSSPIFRHALRLALALGAGYGLILLVPGLRHGNWILLTIAVVMRANYGVTRQRRDDRLFGSIVGCGLAGALLWIGSTKILVGAQLFAVGVLHAFARVNYKIASLAASVMALLALHLLNPTEASPVVARLIDTFIGVVIVFLFNFILPHWERQSAPAIAKRLLRNLSHYADQCLRWATPEQDYRLARKNLIEAMAALSESAARMKSEPEAQKSLWPEYGALIAAAYTTAAQVVNVRLLIRDRADYLDPLAGAHLLDATRRAALSQLDLCATPAGAAASVEPGESDAKIFSVLRRRCDEVLRETAALRRIVADKWVSPIGR